METTNKEYNELITISPMTKFEVYLTLVSGTHSYNSTECETIESEVVKEQKDEECTQDVK